MNVHIIGHGVGAHIAGYTGSGFEEITKITGNLTKKPTEKSKWRCLWFL